MESRVLDKALSLGEIHPKAYPALKKEKNSMNFCADKGVHPN